METTIVYWGYTGIMEHKMETTIVYWGYIGIMEKKMETTIVYWGYTGIMEKKMATTIVYEFAFTAQLGGFLLAIWELPQVSLLSGRGMRNIEDLFCLFLASFFSKILSHFIRLHAY